MRAQAVINDLKGCSSLRKAKVLSSFFKTGKGQYGEGDMFIGVRVPEQRAIAQNYVGMAFDEVQKLLDSPVHEHRLTGLLILVYGFEQASAAHRRRIYMFYKKNLARVNNWDLVDVTCDKIVGAYLLDKERKQLYTWARSSHLWTRRVAIVSTLAFIRHGDFSDTFRIAEMLLEDKHDLIHKAVGWMLREVGKRDVRLLKTFLRKHAHVMPRTMLRYAIERLDDKERKYFMQL